MKKLFATFGLLAILGFSANAQFDISVINKSLAKINDTLYASKSEVSNELYRDYINYLKQKNKITEFNLVQVDTAQWRAPEYNNEPFAVLYFRHPVYDNYPVVNISYEAATMFCKWLTEMYNSDSKRKFKKVVFKLPSEKEWIMAQNRKLRKAGEQDTAKNKSPLNKENNIMSVDTNNFRFNPNNVEDMLNKKGVAKGGDWKNSTKYFSPDENFQYDGSPKPFIGFKYFAVVVEK
jgi:hypothetical protein